MKHLENFGVEGGPSLTLFYGGGINQQGWCSGENARLPLLWSGINSQTWFHMLVEVVFGSCPCCQSFSPGPPVFFTPQKTNTLNFNLIWKQPTRRATLWIVHCWIHIIYYYYYYYYYYNYYYYQRYYLFCHSLCWCSFCASAGRKPCI